MPLAWGGGIFGGGGGGAGSSGTGAAGRVSVWTGPGTIGGYAGFMFDSATNKATLLGGLIDSALTAGRVVIVGTSGEIVDDAGLTYSGTGATVAVGIGTSTPTASIIGVGYPFLDIASAAGAGFVLHDTLGGNLGEFSFYKGSNGVYLDSAGAATLANNDIIFRTGRTISSYTPTEALRIKAADGALQIGGSADTSLSRISAGVVGVGTGAAGSVDGNLNASTLSLRGGTSGARIWLQAGIPGDAYFMLGGTGGTSAIENRLAMASGAITVGNTGYYGFTNSYYSYSLDPDLFLTRRAAATLQLGAADSATPVAQTIAFQGSRGGTDTNTAGQDATIQGSLGTGTGGGGNILVRTAPRGSTGSTQNTPTDRLVLAAKQVTLTESSATPILDVAVPSGTVAGGEVLYTIRADDATDFQALTGRVQWSAVNKGGTLTAAINLVGTETTAVSAGTLTNTATITTGANLITINLNAVSSLTQTTLYAYVQAQNNGTGLAATK